MFYIELFFIYLNRTNKNQTMKTIKRITLLVLISSILTTFSCTKEGKQGPAGTNGTNGASGPTGPTGPSGVDGIPGPQAKTFNFSLTFNAGDTYKSYGGITGYDADDVILFFVHYETLSSTAYWSSLPMIFSTLNIVPEFSDQTGFVFINTLKSNGTAGSPWTSTSTLNFKAVLVKSSQMIANPNIDYSNYYEVKGAFNLKD